MKKILIIIILLVLLGAGGLVVIDKLENVSGDRGFVEEHTVPEEIDDTGGAATMPSEEADDTEEEVDVIIGGKIPAFPGAQGFGMFTRAGRGGRVIEITNVNDSGPGSFREAVEAASGPRIVVFRTGGTIRLSSPLTIRSPHITIAGQTAPGGGIALRGQELRIKTHDVVVRYIRIRAGDEKFGETDFENKDALAIGSEDGDVYNIVIEPR